MTAASAEEALELLPQLSSAIDPGRHPVARYRWPGAHAPYQGKRRDPRYHRGGVNSLRDEGRRTESRRSGLRRLHHEAHRHSFVGGRAFASTSTGAPKRKAPQLPRPRRLPKPMRPPPYPQRRCWRCGASFSRKARKRRDKCCWIWTVSSARPRPRRKSTTGLAPVACWDTRRSAGWRARWKQSW